MSHQSNEIGDSDLLAEVKRRIDGGTLDAILLDTETCRVHSGKGPNEDRAVLGAESILQLVFPFLRYDADSLSQQHAVDALAKLSDEQFRSLKQSAAGNVEAVVESLVEQVKDLRKR